jgi:hypothetical protein
MASTATWPLSSSAFAAPTEKPTKALFWYMAPTAASGITLSSTRPRRQEAVREITAAQRMAAAPCSTWPSDSPVPPRTSAASVPSRVLRRPTALRGLSKKAMGCRSTASKDSTRSLRVSFSPIRLDAPMRTSVERKMAAAMPTKAPPNTVALRRSSSSGIKKDTMNSE